MYRPALKISVYERAHIFINLSLMAFGMLKDLIENTI